MRLLESQAALAAEVVFRAVYEVDVDVAAVMTQLVVPTQLAHAFAMHFGVFDATEEAAVDADRDSLVFSD